MTTHTIYTFLLPKYSNEGNLNAVRINKFAGEVLAAAGG